MRAAFLLLFLIGGCANSSAPTVSLSDATIRGKWVGDGEIAAFLGIPFAQPPVAERRWRAPETTRLAGQVDATTFAPGCMQTDYSLSWYQDLMARFDADPNAFPVPEFSEDCLYLNVWTPDVSDSAGLPVIVWIHGGNHRGGWSYEPNTIGDALASAGAVVVTIAYRLDLFGFFSHPDIEVANFGLLDQAAALAWVRNYIGEFGGDADNVTLMGESAGAASIGYLLAMPGAAGLFDKVIHQSAGYQATTTDRREDWVAEGRRLQSRLPGVDGIDALRNVPAGSLLAAADVVYADYRPAVVADGVTVRKPFAEALAAGDVAAKPLLIGTNADEWKMYLPAEAGEDDYLAGVAHYAHGRGSSLDAVLGNDTSWLRRLDRLTTAAEFVCPSLDMLRANRERNVPGFAYYFSRVRPGPLAASVGAYHGAEIPYVFDKHDDWLPAGETERNLTAAMIAYWVSFARSGRPLPAAGAPEWPAYRDGGAETLWLADSIRVGMHPERDLCAVLADQPRDGGTP